jgi:hypothetical protein
MSRFQKKLVIGGVGLLAIPLIYFGALLIAHDFNPDFLAIDSCLDSGGAGTTTRGLVNTDTQRWTPIFKQLS